MTEDKMALMQLVEKTGDVEFLSELLAYGLNDLMAPEIDQRTSAPAGVRSAERPDAFK